MLWNELLGRETDMRGSIARAAGPIMLLVVAMVSTAAGQISVDLAFLHDSVLPRESAIVRVTVQNRSGEMLVLDEGSKVGGLTVHVERDSYRPAKRINSSQMVAGVDLARGEEKTVELDLARFFDISEMGNYKVRAELDYRGRKYSSTPRILDVVHGMEFRKVTSAVPGYADRFLECGLRYWSRSDSEYLFLTVTDRQTDACYGSFQLGPVVRWLDPEIRASSDGIVTIVHQSGRYRYTRTMFRLAGTGVEFLNQTHHKADGSPYPDEVFYPGKDDDETDEKQKEDAKVGWFGRLLRFGRWWD